MLNSSINAGGPDKQYTAQPLADGGVGFGDLRQYNIDADFIGQAFHTTDNKEYVDTVNMVLYPLSKGLIFHHHSRALGTLVDPNLYLSPF